MPEDVEHSSKYVHAALFQVNGESKGVHAEDSSSPNAEDEEGSLPADPEETERLSKRKPPPSRIFYDTVETVSHVPVDQEITRPVMPISQTLMRPSFDVAEERTHDLLEFPNSAAAVVADLHMRERTQRYADWLAKQARHEMRNTKAEIKAYREEATRIVNVGKQEIVTFAPFRPELSAFRTFITWQVVAICAIGLLGAAGLLLFRLEMLTVLSAISIVLYTLGLVLSVVVAGMSFQNSSEERISDDIVHALKEAEWPIYTILCPLYQEAQVVPQFVKAMLALDYPLAKLQILFLIEADDVETRDAIQALSLPLHFKILLVPGGKPRTKSRACNYGLLYAKGPYTVIYDADDIPDPLQLKKAVLAFASHGTDVVCVQAKLNFYNTRQNLLTRWFAAEYFTWFGLILPGLQSARFSLLLGSTSNHFRTSALRALGGWDAHNVTENCDLGLRLKRYSMNTIMLDSITLEEANPQLKNWLLQRSRWIKGYMQTCLVHTRYPLASLRAGRWYEWFSLPMVLGGRIAVLFINPFLWILLALFIVFGHAELPIYHLLLPRPLLYLAACGLIFGNFFSLYLYLLACMKQKQYSLLLWTLSVPIYWLLMSIAAFYALFELLVKPHHRQKTPHGLRLHENYLSSESVSSIVVKKRLEEMTVPVPLVPAKLSKGGVAPSISGLLVTLPTLMLPAISRKHKQALNVAKRAKVRDLWLVATGVTACIASVTACWYYLQNHEITIYENAYAHLRTARSVFDSATPGLAQLGSSWLPLPHILMWPFIWNNVLWTTGLAGSFVSMPCYVIAAIFLFLSARRLTGSSSASFVGTLLFLFNPNILYLQTTPLSDMVCIATFALTGYYFLSWIQDGRLKQLILTAVCTFLASLASYEGWALFVALLLLIPLIGLLKQQKLPQMGANLLIFGLPAGLGIVLWFAWNKIIFGDPFYFLDGPHAFLAQQLLQLPADRLYAYHNVWQAIHLYISDASQTVGFLLFVLACIGVLWFLLHRRLSLLTVAGFVFLLPLPFYIFALSSGTVLLWLPGANPAGASVYMYNVRYGAEMVLPAALFVAILAERISTIPLRVFRPLGQFICVGIILIQSILISSQGIISLQDGQYNYACNTQFTIINYLSEHYDDQDVLQDLFTTGIDPAEFGANVRKIISEGSGPLWLQAVHDPAHSVAWILVNPEDKSDLVARYIDIHSSIFLSQFTLVAQQSDGVLLYHRMGQPPLPDRPAPTLLQFKQHACM